MSRIGTALLVFMNFECIFVKKYNKFVHNCGAITRNSCLYEGQSCSIRYFYQSFLIVSVNAGENNETENTALRNS